MRNTARMGWWGASLTKFRQIEKFYHIHKIPLIWPNSVKLTKLQRVFKNCFLTVKRLHCWLCVGICQLNVNTDYKTTSNSTCKHATVRTLVFEKWGQYNMFLKTTTCFGRKFSKMWREEILSSGVNSFQTEKTALRGLEKIRLREKIRLARKFNWNSAREEIHLVGRKSASGGNSRVHGSGVNSLSGRKFFFSWRKRCRPKH